MFKTSTCDNFRRVDLAIALCHDFPVDYDPALKFAVRSVRNFTKHFLWIKVFADLSRGLVDFQTLQEFEHFSQGLEFNILWLTKTLKVVVKLTNLIGKLEDLRLLIRFLQDLLSKIALSVEEVGFDKTQINNRNGGLEGSWGC